MTTVKRLLLLHCNVAYIFWSFIIFKPITGVLKIYMRPTWPTFSLSGPENVTLHIFSFVFVPHISFCWCLGRAVIRDCGISCVSLLIFGPADDKIYNKTCITSKDSDQPVHPFSMSREFVYTSLDSLGAVKSICDH